MRAFLISAGAVVLLLVAGFFAFNSYIYHEKQGGGLPSDFRRVTFFISGEPVTLVDGVAQTPTAPHSASVNTTRYFGNEFAHDIDGDGVDDMVFLVTQETGGSGTFFYLVGALKREGGYEGTHAVYIGDRIASQTTNAGEGRQVIVNYADRAPGESFSIRPSIGKSLYLLFDPQTREFGEVSQDFEGEDNWPDAAQGNATFDINSIVGRYCINVSSGRIT